MLHFVETDRPFFLGSKLLNRQIFMEPGILTMPAYSLGVLIEVEFGRFTVEFPGEKKNTPLIGMEHRLRAIPW